MDWVARIGGEEFAIVLPETSYEAARAVARKLLTGVSGAKFNTEKRNVLVTASFGLCTLERGPARRTSIGPEDAEDCRPGSVPQQTRRPQSRDGRDSQWRRCAGPVIDRAKGSVSSMTV